MLIEASEDNPRPATVQGLQRIPVTKVLQTRKCIFTDKDHGAFNTQVANRWAPTRLETSPHSRVPTNPPQQTPKCTVYLRGAFSKPAKSEKGDRKMDRKLAESRNRVLLGSRMGTRNDIYSGRFVEVRAPGNE
ncbi:hypothetical protein PMIN06_011960 [Paraphaeosphaeria minitans]